MDHLSSDIFWGFFGGFVFEDLGLVELMCFVSFCLLFFVPCFFVAMPLLSVGNPFWLTKKKPRG